MIDNLPTRATTDQFFQHTFKLRQVYDPETHTYETEEPFGLVRMPSYLDAYIPFDFYVPNAKFVRHSVPVTMTASVSYAVSVTMRNTSTNSWTAGGDTPFRLGSQSPQDNMTWGVGRIELPVASVAPGTDVTFSFNVQAPTTPGTYHFQWRMLQEFVLWFGDFSTDVAVRVIPPH